VKSLLERGIFGLHWQDFPNTMPAMENPGTSSGASHRMSAQAVSGGAHAACTAQCGSGTHDKAPKAAQQVCKGLRPQAARFKFDGVEIGGVEGLHDWGLRFWSVSLPLNLGALLHLHNPDLLQCGIAVSA
jgi:hypothetical protein